VSRSCIKCRVSNNDGGFAIQERSKLLSGPLCRWIDSRAVLWGGAGRKGYFRQLHRADVAVLILHLIVMMVRLARPGGLRSVVAESVLVKHQLVILNRGRKRAPNLRTADRVIAGLCSLFMRQPRIVRSAITLKPSTLLDLHAVLTKRKYRLLFSPRCGGRPGPKGPTKELIAAVVAMKQRNPRVENHCSGAWPGCLFGSSILAPIFMGFRGPAGPTGHLGLSPHCRAGRLGFRR